MSKLSCKLKNSFAIDAKGKLYSWGTNDYGMLGYSTEKDIIITTKIPLEEKINNEYECQMVSCGHFHTGVIVNKIYHQDKMEDFNFCKESFQKLKEWLYNEMNFIITKNQVCIVIGSSQCL